MNFRVSFILLVLVVVIGGYVFLFQPQSQPEGTPPAPWFYEIDYNDITNISITYQGERQDFAITDGGWIFEDTGEPVDIERWGGIPFLLGGPRTSRALVAEQVDNPADFGLDPPESTITMTMESERQISLLLGIKSPDGNSHYAQMVGFPSLFLVTSSWGDVLNRLVTEPPVVAAVPEAT